MQEAIFDNLLFKFHNNRMRNQDKRVMISFCTTYKGHCVCLFVCFIFTPLSTLFKGHCDLGLKFVKCELKHKCAKLYNNWIRKKVPRAMMSFH